MAISIEGRTIEEHETEYGVKFDDGFVCACFDEEDARTTRQITGGSVVKWDVYKTAVTVIG